MADDYQLVQLANGEKTLFSERYGEKMHPGLGPQAEAELLYVRQLNIVERLQKHTGEFVIWDIGLGAAANAIAALQAAKEIAGELRIVSFDNTKEPLEFALKHAASLGYPAGYEIPMKALIEKGRAELLAGKLNVNWEFHLGDFPVWLERAVISAIRPPAPHAIFFDAFSPAKNPAMWTLPLFENLFRIMDAGRPCGLTTYSRSTMLRVTLLLAGFFVGAGRATGMKEETTVAANTLDLITQPLDARWLQRAERSDSASPLQQPVYTRHPLTPELLERLRRHPQFSR